MKRIGTFVVVASLVFALPAAAQTAGKSIAAAAVAVSVYAGLGSKECLKSPSNIRPDSDGACSLGAWDRYPYEASRRKTQVAGGMLAAGISSIFLFKPASSMAEGWSYLAMGGGMITGAFDYRCRGVRTAHFGCVDTRRDNFGGYGTESTFERPSLAYGGMAMIALGVARMLMPDERAPNWEIGAAPDGFRIARVVGW